VHAQVQLPGEGRSLAAVGVSVLLKSAAEDMDGRWTLFEYTAPPGFAGPPPHWHKETDEAFFVLEGIVRFEVDGETVDAPAGTLVFVRPESRRKATGDATVLALGATPGEAYNGVDWGDVWQFHNEALTAYGEQRYDDAVRAVRSGLDQSPDHPGLHYNLACFATLAGDTGDETFEHLRRSVELLPRFREQAPRDDDFAAVRDDPRFEEVLR
jgi:mannose-6-phosphate isomerase-like protein (cupin superfamily)